MKKIFCALFVTAICLTNLRAAQPVWKDLEWGMTVDQVQKVHPEIAALGESARPAPNNSRERKQWILPMVEIDGTQLLPHLIFSDHGAGGLEEIILERPIGGKDQPIFESFRDLFIQKYGTPVNEDRDAVQSATWKTDQSLIEVSVFSGSWNKFPGGVTINYRALSAGTDGI